MRKTVLALALAALAAPALAQNAAPGPWLVRVRAVNLNMDNKSEPGSGALTPALLPGDALQASNKTIPEADITYFFTKHLAAELILTVPQKHNVKIATGPLAEGIGSFKHLPPTLTLQWHFLPDAAIRPYVGAGINYTKISGVNLFSTKVPATLTLDSSSTGAALQAGFDVPFGRNMVFNVDVKKLYISTDVKVAGAKVSALDLNPLAVGVGIGWRF